MLGNVIICFHFINLLSLPSVADRRPGDGRAPLLRPLRPPLPPPPARPRLQHGPPVDGGGRHATLRTRSIPSLPREPVQEDHRQGPRVHRAHREALRNHVQVRVFFSYQVVVFFLLLLLLLLLLLRIFFVAAAAFATAAAAVAVVAAAAGYVASVDETCVPESGGGFSFAFYTYFQILSYLFSSPDTASTSFRIRPAPWASAARSGTYTA